MRDKSKMVTHEERYEKGIKHYQWTTGKPPRVMFPSKLTGSTQWSEI